MAKAQAKEKEGEADEKEDKKNAKDEGAKEGKEAPEGEGGEAGAEGEAAPAKSKKKLIIIGAGALVLLLAIGGGAFMFLKPHEDKSETEAGANGKSAEKPVYYTLPEFLINLNSGGKSTSFLKTTVILELTKQTDVPLIEANMPRLQDSFNTYLRELRASDLAGSAGIQRLREELLLRANKALAPVKVNDALFKEIVIQ